MNGFFLVYCTYPGPPLFWEGGGGAFFKAAAFLYVCDIGRIEESGLV